MSAESRTLIGSSPALDAVRRAVAQVAPTDATVLVLGETGMALNAERVKVLKPAGGHITEKLRPV